MKKFDLNIEKILENWEVSHALREIIANALDEQLLTETEEVEIFKRNHSWIIRDYGRGLRHMHLTQNENEEKLNSPLVIGKFGIGLKDALATFDRKGIKVRARSKFNTVTITRSGKQDFQDINTLHAVIEDPTDSNYKGTEFEMIGVQDQDIEDAKNLFLKFSGEAIIENVKTGQIIRKNGRQGNIYINGVKVAEEENFLFSYNITVRNASIKKALNRERTNVGRSAYSESIKKILLASKSNEIAEVIGKDLKNINLGTAHDELGWIDVQVHSVKILNQFDKYFFVTSQEAMESPSMIDRAKATGREVIIVPQNLKDKIRGAKDLAGNPIIDSDQFISDYNDSFDFTFIKPEELNAKEKQIYDRTSEIIEVFGGIPKHVKSIRISSTMQEDFFEQYETQGCWDEATGCIVISRKTLRSLAVYSGTLIHELIHAKTGQDDVTRDFEISLTHTIGLLCERLLQ